MGNCQKTQDEQQIEFNREVCDEILTIQTSTWQRDSYGLYDYESKSQIQQLFRVQSEGVLVRHEGKVKWLENNDINDYNYSRCQRLMNIKINKQTGFDLSNPLIDNDIDHYVMSLESISQAVKLKDCSQSLESAWIVILPQVQSQEEQDQDKKLFDGYRLQEGDVLKFG